MKNPKINFVYNFIYQLLILVIPLITAPYLSRVVGVEGVGIYSYRYSIVYYFMLFTMLGVNNYGNRTISKVRDDKNKLSREFWSIYIFQFFVGLIMIGIYFLYIFLFDIQYKNISIIQSLFIFSAMFDINWFFFGLEEFKKTITRNIIIKIANIVLILLFVKSASDLWKYTLIMSSMTFFGQIILWTFLKNRIFFSGVKFKDIIAHIKPNLILFIPVVAVSLYKMMDKIMLGYFSGVSEVGLYESAEKIINIPLTIITALGTVMLPRISNIISKGNEDLVKKYIDKSISFVSFMSFAMCFGLIAIGRKFAPLYFGNAFMKTGNIIVILSFSIPFVSFANVIRTQYLIPKEKDSIFIFSVFVGALINLICNLIFIPMFDSYGACIGTIAAEIIVMLYQCIFVAKDLPIITYLKSSFNFFIKSLIMFLIIMIFDLLDINLVFKILFQIAIGFIVYLILNYKYLASIVNIKEIFKKMKSNS